MKHYFHFIVAVVLLLCSLILLNNQKDESFSQLSEPNPIDHLELLAELPSKGAESLYQVHRLNPGLFYTCIPGKFKQHKSVYTSDHQPCMKRQMQIHLELKPLIAELSGSLLLHRPSYDDPPVS